LRHFGLLRERCFHIFQEIWQKRIMKWHIFSCAI
jgi:hypothetical protein